MEFLVRFEKKINEWLWSLFYSFYRFIPKPLRNLITQLSLKLRHFGIKLKLFPWYLLKKVNQVQAWVSSILADADLKERISELEVNLKEGSYLQGIKVFLHKSITTFIFLMKRPFNGLTFSQSFFLILLTFSSTIAGLTIFYKLQKIYLEETSTSRSPASTESLDFDRPQYYKEVFRQVQINGVRVPVYFPETNELQTVTIDFSVTLSNRIGRIFVEGREFPIRDHLVQHLEPVLAQYALVEEGKVIIKEKIAREIQEFLDVHKVPSEVQDVSLQYILAN